jgi:hypothetical protein
MKYLLYPILGATIIGLIFLNGVCCGVHHTCTSFSNGTRKVFTWSNVEQLNAELAKGYTIESTYNVTNMILKKVSK